MFQGSIWPNSWPNSVQTEHISFEYGIVIGV